MTKNTGSRFAPWELEVLRREHGQDLIDEILEAEVTKQDGRLESGKIVGVGSHGFIVEEDGEISQL